MSLDNVLAVAGASRSHPVVLVIGLVLSVALTGVAAEFLAQLIERFRGLAYLAIGAILVVAVKMLVGGWQAFSM